MMPTNNEIGAKIRDLREMRRVSVEELAERSQLTVEKIHAIESGGVTTSLTPLLSIARGLGVRLGTFLDDSTTSGPVVSRADKKEKTSVRFAGAGQSGLEFHALATNKSDRNMEPFIIDVHAPESDEYELSSHEGEEFIYVLSGTLEAVVGKEKYVINAGDSIYYDSIVPHHVHSVKGVETRILAVIYTPN